MPDVDAIPSHCVSKTSRSCSHESLSASFLNEVSILIQNSPVPGDDASSSLGLRLQRLDGREGVDRITENDRAMKLPFEDGQKRESIDARCLAHQSGGDGQTEQSVSHGLAEGVALRGRMIDMQRIEVSGKAREEDDIRFRDGPSRAFPLITDDKIIE